MFCHSKIGEFPSSLRPLPCLAKIEVYLRFAHEFRNHSYLLFPEPLIRFMITAMGKKNIHSKQCIYLAPLS